MTQVEQPADLESIRLRGGCEIASPCDRLRRFCLAEYEYYDSIQSEDPNRIDPIDVLVTVPVNLYINSALAALRRQIEDKRKVARVATTVLQRFREDLRAAIDDLQLVRRRLAADGYDLSPVRILEVLVWTEMENRGHYRSFS